MARCRDTEAIEAGVETEIAGAVAFAEAGTWEPVEDLVRDVYTPGRCRRTRGTPTAAAQR